LKSLILKERVFKDLQSICLAGSANQIKPIIQHQFFHTTTLQIVRILKNLGGGGDVLDYAYICSSCKFADRHFFVAVRSTAQIKVSGELLRWKITVQKIGQDPVYDISIDKSLERDLGDFAGYYKKGLISESHSYGIGAFSYFRRVVEGTIDTLLEGILEELSGDERAKYQKELEKIKSGRIATDKINLVKNMVPVQLRPGGENPLDVMYGLLSEGMHSDSDEECLESAARLKAILNYLIGQIQTAKSNRKEYMDAMKGVLDKKARKAAVNPRLTPAT